jgi:predicted ATPase/DNA-binding winged helix-turn-helix (wHTH) protein
MDRGRSPGALIAPPVGPRDARRSEAMIAAERETSRIDAQAYALADGAQARSVTQRVVSFGPFQLYPERSLLLEQDQPVRLGGRAFDMLVALVERPGEVVGKSELMSRVWPNTHVDEVNLRFQIASLRRALGDGQGSARYIKTVSGQGYRFIAQVCVDDPPADPVSNPPAAPPPGNLPVVLTRAIGRDPIISEIAAQLPSKRFVSIIGAGGIGKTTVAMAVAERLARVYAHGVCLVDLAPLGDDRFVASAIGAALGLSIVADDPVSTLMRYLKDQHMLIVLDNCEHVVDAAALLAETLLKGAPDLNLIVTSRERLRAEGEYTYRLGPMEVPPAEPAPTTASALAYPSIQLFVQRAVSHDDRFVLSDEEAPIVAGICRHLDGIPLAIDLCVARLDALGVKGLAARIEDRFSLVMKGRRTALARHQTLKAMFDWSFDRLCPAEQYLLMQLSVFKAPFSLDWAAAIAERFRHAGLDVTYAMESLVSKSLVTSDVNGPMVRYRLLELTRLYAWERLKEQGTPRRLQQQHADHMLAVLQAAALDRSGAAARAWCELHPGALDEVRAALDWAFSEDGDCALGSALTAVAAPIWIHYALMEECCERIERALSQSGAGENPWRDLRLNASLAAALIHARGVCPAMGEAWRRAAALAERLDDADYRLRCLWGLWLGCFMGGDYRGALNAASRFSVIPEQQAPLADRLVGARLLALTHHVLGDQTTARRHIEVMLERYDAPADQSHRVRYQHDQRVAALSLLGQILWVQGLPDQAMRAVETAVGEAKSTGHAMSMFYALHYGACPVALQCGNIVRANRFIEMRDVIAPLTPYWRLWRQCSKGLLLIESGDPVEGTRLLRAALSGMPTAGFQQRYVSFLGALAAGALAAGDRDDAAQAIDHALRLSRREEDRWCLAELLRIKGEVVLAGGSDAEAEAEALFEESFDWSRRQGALSWELRTALSFARLRRAQGRQAEACALLDPVYRRFTEGFETSDLIRARDLLGVA